MVKEQPALDAAGTRLGAFGCLFTGRPTGRGRSARGVCSSRVTGVKASVLEEELLFWLRFCLWSWLGRVLRRYLRARPSQRATPHMSSRAREMMCGPSARALILRQSAWPILRHCAVSIINALLARPGCSVVGRVLRWRLAMDMEAMSHLSGGRLGAWSRRRVCRPRMQREDTLCLLAVAKELMRG